MVSGPVDIRGITLLSDMDGYYKSKKDIWMVAGGWS